MANSIKYNTGSESRALNKGNWWIGTGDVGKGPTNLSGYWNGYDIPGGGYVIYLNKATGGPSVYAPANDAELISLTNQIAGTSYTNVKQCFSYYNDQPDKMILDQDYEEIVTDGLIMNLDAGFLPSYPRTGDIWYDLSGNGNHATLFNGASYDSGDGGSISFDSADDTAKASGVPVNTNESEGNTVEQWIYWNGVQNEMTFTWGNIPWNIWINSGGIGINNGASLVYGPSNSGLANRWAHIAVYFPNGWSSSYLDAKMYIDGESQTMSIRGGSLANRSISESQEIAISGSYNGGTGNYSFGGKIQVTRIYNRELTSAEILQNYNTTKTRFGL